MVTRFKAGGVTFSLITSQRGLRDYEVSIDAIGPDPSLWSKRDDAKRRGGLLKDTSTSAGRRGRKRRKNV